MLYVVPEYRCVSTGCQSCTQRVLVRADEHGGLKLTANARAALMSRLAGVPGVSTLPPALTGVVPGVGMPGAPADIILQLHAIPCRLLLSAFLPCVQQGFAACAYATSL